MQLRTLSNDDLFALYDSDLVLRVRNAKNLSTVRGLLAKFKEYLGGFPPSKELAKGFVAQYVSRKPVTLYTYYAHLRSFMAWYGEPLGNDVRRPKSLPPYIATEDIDKLDQAMAGKRTHKGTIERDRLLLFLGRRTGLRCSEMANLEVRHCHPEYLEVRNGKGGKDRVVPIGNELSKRLQTFIAGRWPEEKVFGLKAVSISDKIRNFAQKAGVNLHTHSLRHSCATTLIQKGANPEAVRQWLGHESLSTTQMYVSLARGQLGELAKLFDDVPQGNGHRADNGKALSHNTDGLPQLERPLMSWEIAELVRRSAELARLTS